MDRVSRRQFVGGAGMAGFGLVAGCGLARPSGPPAAGGTKVRLIGVLGDTPTARWDAFRRGLASWAGWRGDNLAVEYRWVEGNTDRSQRFAAELAQLQVEGVAAGALPAATAAKHVTSTVPIVAILATWEALENGLVDNIARPGGNITGTAGISGAQLEGKQLQLLKETVPQAARVAILARATQVGFELRLPRHLRAGRTVGCPQRVQERTRGAAGRWGT